MGSYRLRFAFFHLTTAHLGVLSPSSHRTFLVFVAAQSFIVKMDRISLQCPCWGQTGCVQFGCTEGPYTQILCSGQIFLYGQFLEAMLLHQKSCTFDVLMASASQPSIEGYKCSGGHECLSISGSYLSQWWDFWFLFKRSLLLVTWKVPFSAFCWLHLIL